ncbi:hypothetical protein C499_03063 [Halogeometricum borinquense DSM 11551]|uniref:Uncharacterized protein n=1 Tax=Halogeometricum borinquense (strain ATCC 700274 / DSM 11551 / JCM 10706 / KCTC 4070 / PR3) TaxID=469382 RepID=E4NQL5_HALBP|nr:hypothetical protein Hbor_11130 [Halogeometricum borinquense DSM 11551]ELY30212.1 hypothetical protein C499_03063 [Halogeometricum borinquense DSM 11551]
MGDQCRPCEQTGLPAVTDLVHAAVALFWGTGIRYVVVSYVADVYPYIIMEVVSANLDEVSATETLLVILAGCHHTLVQTEICLRLTGFTVEPGWCVFFSNNDSLPFSKVVF